MKRIAILALFLSPAPALAHDAPSGWAYDPACCQSRDCHQVQRGAIREVAGGFSVVIEPGTHPMLPRGAPRFEAFIAHGDTRIRPSGDEHRHACISPPRWPDGRRFLLCIYVEPGGV